MKNLIIKFPLFNFNVNIHDNRPKNTHKKWFWKNNVLTLSLGLTFAPSFSKQTFLRIFMSRFMNIHI